MIDIFQKLEARIDALGSEPTEAQLDALESWVVENIGPAYWGEVSARLLASEGACSIYTDIQMRRGEMGL